MATSNRWQLPARAARAAANLNIKYVESDEDEFPEEIAGKNYHF